ncbi:pentatricopeptide repeat-containing protein, partial [Nannochloropsis gaditana CCMP526]
GESGSPSRSTAPPPSRVGGSTGLPLPDQYSYNTVLRALGEEDLGAAIALYREMRDAGVQPDRVTVNTLVAACAAHGRLDRGLLILESSAVPASVEGYTALISALAGKGELEKARDVLESMRAAGVAPNARTYTALLQGAARAGDMAG